MNRRTIPIACYLTLVLTLGGFFAMVTAAKPNGAAGATKEDFFIVSSVDVQKHQMLLKMPNEVTLQMALTPKTTVVGQNGQAMKVTDLRAGDTGYITYVQNGTGTQAVKVRLAGMTREELLRRYLNGPVPPAPPAAPARKAPAPAVSPQPAKVERGRA